MATRTSARNVYDPRVRELIRTTGNRLPTGKAKADILRAVDAVRKTLPLRAAVRVLGLSLSRYHAWKRAERACDLTDRSSCPKTFPGQLTAQEAAIIQEMVTVEEYRHVPTTTLAMLAQRLGRVFASASTWARLVRTRGWRRPRTRVHPAKPKVGLRAVRPNEYWYVDTTVIRLLDGTKPYLQAVLHDFSRRILAWHLAQKLSPLTTCKILADAARYLPTRAPEVAVITDGGRENVNGTVDAALGTGPLRRVLAQIDIVESNSILEAWWRSLRHQWLYLNTLDTATAVRRLVAFYVTEHNEVLPHSALNGRTPDEVYFGRAEDIPEELAGARKVARKERLAANRNLSCAACVAPGPAASAQASAA
jgi:putative transposase